MAIEVPIAHIEIMDGTAYIKGRMLKVRMVAGMYIHAGATIEAVMAHYDLSAGQVHAALAYYYDHLDDYAAEDDAARPLIETAKAQTDARLSEIRARYKDKKHG
jgi:uncharacterized protein (DUF433 family)